MQTRSDCFALHDNVLLYIMLLCKGEHLTESRKPTIINICNVKQIVLILIRKPTTIYFQALYKMDTV